MSHIYLDIRVDSMLSEEQLEEFEHMVSQQIWQTEKYLGATDMPHNVYPKFFVKSIGTSIEKS